MPPFSRASARHCSSAEVDQFFEISDSRGSLRHVQKYLERQGFGEKSAEKYATLGNQLLIDDKLDQFDDDKYDAIAKGSFLPPK